MDVGPLRDLVTVVLGVGTGLLSGVFGVGGGVISQPGMRLLGLPPLMVIGTALPVIIPGAASGTVRYARESLVEWPAVTATIPAGLATAVVGSMAAEHVPGDGHVLQLVTALLLGWSSYRMAFGAPGAARRWRIGRPAPHASSPAPATAGSGPSPSSLTARYTGTGVVAGLLSGLLGIGGGVLMVPSFVQVAGMEVKRAIATSLVCVGAFAVPGTITHAVQGHVDWRVAAALVVGVVPGARLGAALAIKATDRRLRAAVGSFLGGVAVIYAASELAALL